MNRAFVQILLPAFLASTTLLSMAGTIGVASAEPFEPTFGTWALLAMQAATVVLALVSVALVLQTRRIRKATARIREETERLRRLHDDPRTAALRGWELPKADDGDRPTLH